MTTEVVLNEVLFSKNICDIVKVQYVTNNDEPVLDDLDKLMSHYLFANTIE